MYAEKTDYGDIEMLSRLRNILRRNGFESLEELGGCPKEHFSKSRTWGIWKDVSEGYKRLFVRFKKLKAIYG